LDYLILCTFSSRVCYLHQGRINSANPWTLCHRKESLLKRRNDIMGVLLPLIRIGVALLFCFLVSLGLPNSCNGVLPEPDSPIPQLSPLFVILAILPEPLPQIALLWRTTSASCCVLSLALSIVHPHTAMLFFGWKKQYHIHHPIFYVLAIIRSIFSVVMPWLFDAERQVIIDMLTVIINFLGKMKRPLTEEEKRAKEANRKYVYVRPPSCRHCSADQCTCEPVRVRVKRVNTLRGSLKWFRRWLQDNQQEPLFNIPELRNTVNAAEQPDPDPVQPEVGAEANIPVEESKKDI